MKEVFIIVGKLPLSGYSKTRLADEVGEVESIKLYEAFLQDFFKSYVRLAEEIELFFFTTPESIETKNYFVNLFKEINLNNYNILFQRGDSFFEKIENAFKDVENRIGECFVHLTGTDIPDFPFGHIRNETQNKYASYIGPDRDGGYYYIGTNIKNANCLNITECRKNSVFNNTLTNFKDKEIEINLLKEWSDVDDQRDLIYTLNRSQTLLENTLITYRKYCSED